MNSIRKILSDPIPDGRRVPAMRRSPGPGRHLPADQSRPDPQAGAVAGRFLRHAPDSIRTDDRENAGSAGGRTGRRRPP
ncbi:hypothetical protein ABB55_11890 [Prosthecomicrobium hirschii]|uniref:Uncharacterized protein n=1 Tax=Prosthecodimorpha hirschii TaxID=665126 RepID=A0A0N8GEY6_9HYPH|nr:hypothetical protein ABB55_11890 [Prosthecomicrobium hirschii]